MLKIRSMLACAVLLVCVPCHAQLVRVEVQTVENCDSGYCQKVTNQGSGVVIGLTEDGRSSVVATVGHAFDGDVQSITVSGLPGQLVARKRDRNDDIAIVTVAYVWPTSTLAETDPVPGTKLKLSGFPRGELTYRTGTAVTDDEASMQAEPGFSGGPLVNEQRQVCGMCYARNPERNNRTVFTPASRIRTFVKARIRMKVVTEIAPPPPIVASDIESRLAAIEKQLRAGTPEQKPDPIEWPHQAVLPGPQGPPGKAGSPGVAGPPGVVTIILRDASGTVLNRQEAVASGSTIDLNVTKFLKGK